LAIDVDGVTARTWFGYEKKIRWEDIVSLHYHFGSKYFTVRDRDRRKIVHTAFHVEGKPFRDKVREHTRLPMKITRGGILKRETIELPYIGRK
jgi:hypothetical protein